MSLFHIVFYLILTLQVISLNSTEMIITNPGIYQLGNNILSSPTAADSIIIINSSNVILNLNNYVIAQFNATANVNGIKINDGYTDISIQNGIIRSVTNNGILVGNSSTRIAVENVTFENCQTHGLAIDASTITTTNINVTNCDFFGCCNSLSTGTVIYLNNVQNALLSNCIIASTSNVQTNASINMIGLQNCSSCDIFDCDISGNYAANINLFNLNNTIQSGFSGCICRDNSTSGTLNGFSLNLSSTNRFNGCYILRNNSLDTFRGVLTDIFSTQNFFTECFVMSNSAATLLSAFDLQAMCIQLLGCAVLNNTLSGNIATCTGYKIQNNLSSLVNSLAIGNRGVGTSITAVGLDIIPSFSTNRATIVESIFLDNIGSTNATSFGARVPSAPNNVGNLFTKNIAFNNGTTSGNQFNNVPAISASTAAGLTSTALQPWTNIAVIP